MSDVYEVAARAYLASVMVNGDPTGAIDEYAPLLVDARFRAAVDAVVAHTRQKIADEAGEP